MFQKRSAFILILLLVTPCFAAKQPRADNCSWQESRLCHLDQYEPNRSRYSTWCCRLGRDVESTSSLAHATENDE